MLCQHGGGKAGCTHDSDVGRNPQNPHPHWDKLHPAPSSIHRACIPCWRTGPHRQAPSRGPSSQKAVPKLLYQEITSRTMTRAKRCPPICSPSHWIRAHHHLLLPLPFWSAVITKAALMLQHIKGYCVKRKKVFCCSNYPVVILSKLLAARTEASLSYFLLLPRTLCRDAGCWRGYPVPRPPSFSRRRLSCSFLVYVLPPPVTDGTFPGRCNATAFVMTTAVWVSLSKRAVLSRSVQYTVMV